MLYVFYLSFVYNLSLHSEYNRFSSVKISASIECLVHGRCSKNICWLKELIQNHVDWILAQGHPPGLRLTTYETQSFPQKQCHKGKQWQCPRWNKLEMPADESVWVLPASAGTLNVELGCLGEKGIWIIRAWGWYHYKFINFAREQYCLSKS